MPSPLFNANLTIFSYQKNKKVMRQPSLLVLSVMTLFLLHIVISKAHAFEAVTIYIRDDVYEDYQSFVGNREVSSIDNFDGKSVRRDVIDMIIAQQALKLGGFNHKFIYIPGKLNFRNTKMLQKGNLLISFDSYWLEDAKLIEKDVYISEPVIRRGEYVAGFYTSKNNTKALALSSTEQLKNFTAVSTPKWITDWNTITGLPLKEVIREDEWLSMARMVDIGWVDFIFMPFHGSDDKSFKLESIELVPVPNIAIELKGSRHFVISKNHPLGLEAFEALSDGLNQLRAKHQIVKAYTQAGFFIVRNKVKVLNR
jgi:hypothetical protein